MTPADADGRPPARVLVVDDDRANRQLLETMLAGEGLTFLSAASGEEALDVVTARMPDLILLDVMLPGLDGHEVATRIKSDPRTKNIPIIMVTAHDDRAARMRGLSAGAEDFLTKPVDRIELCMRVRNLLRLRAAIADADGARVMAERANSAKTQFLRAISHELRTPLNAISGYTELLQMGIRGPVSADQVKDLDRIKRASGYLLCLIEDVLTVARLEGARALRPVSISVNSMLNEVHGLCALQADAKGVSFAVTPASDDLMVTADLERFQQILLNLITNAIKFCPQGGDVAVIAEHGGDLARIRVVDSGIGVPAIDADRIFDPFVQIDPHLTPMVQQGLGLGLSISRELARAMQGDVTLESTEGIGSTFELTLPLSKGLSQPEAERQPGRLTLVVR